MGKKEQVPALAIFVQGSLWVWSAATSRKKRILFFSLVVVRGAEEYLTTTIRDLRWQTRLQSRQGSALQASLQVQPPKEQ